MILKGEIAYKELEDEVIGSGSGGFAVQLLARAGGNVWSINLRRIFSSMRAAHCKKCAAGTYNNVV